MKMFLTRIGFNSKAVITGDITQIDLPNGNNPVCVTPLKCWRMCRGVRVNFFHSEDVVRHPMAAQIVIAYEAWEAAEQKRKQMLKQQRDANVRRRSRNNP
ncbi:PhoH family protein [Shigella flexneri]